MSINNLFKALIPAFARRPLARRSQPTRRPYIEPLEDRLVPSFSPLVDYAGAPLGALAAVDLNGDGLVDLGPVGSGGYSGGMRGYSVNSVNRTRCTPEQQALVASAVTAAHPESWARSYPDISGGLTDQFYDTITLEADGKKYVSSWSTGSGGMPPDLVRLAAAVRACH